jgi:hypothetical protein
MGQSFNLSQVANKVNSNGQYDVQQLTGVFGIAQGGTNNTSLSTPLGSVLYTDGSAIQSTSAGSSGQFLVTNGPSSVPSWASLSSTANLLLGQANMSGSGTITVSGLSLSSFKMVLVEIKNASTMMAISSLNIGTATCNWNSTTTGSFNGSVLIDLTYGGCGGMGIGSPAFPFVSPAKGSHGYTTASMSISVQALATSFMSGTMILWGVY